MLSRVDRLRQAMEKAGLEAALVTSRENMRYLSGFTSADAVVVVTMRDCLLFTDFRYTIQAKEQSPDCTLVEITYANLKEKVRDALVQSGAKRCGFEQTHMNVADYEEYREMPVALVPFASEITSLRLIKTAEEIENLRTAQQMADKAYAALLERVHPGMTEREVVAELNYLCEKAGSEGPSFDPIVGSGPNGAMCHAVPGERRLQKGDLVVVDFGCMYNGYHSDMTRTFGVEEADDISRRVYDIVLEAQLRTLDALKAGMTGGELDAVARDYIASQGYGDCFGHGLGHGFGLEIHEAPRAGKNSADMLLAGTTITVEPGIYIEGKCGVRIEDCCIVTEDGKINLVSSPKELQMIS